MRQCHSVRSCDAPCLSPAAGGHQPGESEPAAAAPGRQTQALHCCSSGCAARDLHPGGREELQRFLQQASVSRPELSLLRAGLAGGWGHGKDVLGGTAWPSRAEVGSVQAGRAIAASRMTEFSVKGGERLHHWPERAEAALGIDLINGVFGGKWHRVFHITDESGGQCQHTRSAQAQLWLAGLCLEQSLARGWGGFSFCFGSSVCRKQSMKSYPAQRLLRLRSEQDVPPANLPSQALLCPEFHFQKTSGEANLPPIAVDYQQGRGARFPAV